jgi:hypothetical protein
MEADFSGYATKAGLKCSDGRTIMPDAFKHQDQMQVPLVWQHGHSDPGNVLGHAILEARPDGVYAYGFFNDTQQAQTSRSLLEHKDINMMSIWANDLIERAGRVLHGAIREVSLVLSGANPGAMIENVTIRHSNGDETVLDDEVYIRSGIEVELEHSSENDTEEKTEDKTEDKSEEKTEDKSEEKTDEDDKELELQHADSDEKTVGDVVASMSEEQQQVLHYLVGKASGDSGDDDSVKQDNINDKTDDDKTDDDNTNSKGNEMKHNVFEKTDDEGKEKAPVSLSHGDMQAIFADAAKPGNTLREAVQDYALSHGIEDIDLLFPDHKNLSNTPELWGRRVEWVSTLLAGVRKSPFSRIKTMSADLTVAEARAKGYIKGSLKKEEFFRVSKRTTQPTTIYKKQKLDRDDMVDITDFDVVAWLKAEMRLMLDEELARAILVGDGRAVDDEDKIDEDSIRPIASDHEVYTTTVTVNIDDASSNMGEVLDNIVLNRKNLRGSGLPTLFTTETYIARFLLFKDGMQRKMYKSLDEVASDLRVASIVPVEILEEYTDIVAILVNLNDYVVGATAGGQVSMFDDFDIDYNQYKYLIETRCSGALTKLKSAMVVKKTAGTNVAVAPAAPAFDGDGITITNQTGVVYRNADTDAVMNNAGSPYAVADGVTVTVNAEPASGYYFETSENDSWSFTGEA